MLTLALFAFFQGGGRNEIDNSSDIEEPDSQSDYADASQVTIVDSATNEEIENNKITVCEFYSKQIELVADDGYELPPDISFRSSNPAMLAVDDSGGLFYISRGQCQLIISDDKDFTKVINVETVPLVTVNNMVPLQVTDTDGLGGVIRAVITEITYDQTGIYVSGNVISVTGAYIGSSGWWLMVAYNMSTGEGGEISIGKRYYKTGDSFYREKIVNIRGEEPVTITISSRR